MHKTGGQWIYRAFYGDAAQSAALSWFLYVFCGSDTKEMMTLT